MIVLRGERRHRDTFSMEQLITIKGLQGKSRGTGHRDADGEGGRGKQKVGQQDKVTKEHLFWCWRARKNRDCSRNIKLPCRVSKTSRMLCAVNENKAPIL